MKKFLFFLAVASLVCVRAVAAPGELTTEPSVPLVGSPIELKYYPNSKQQWMVSQDVYLYVCLEFDGNGEWVKEKAPWDKCIKPNLKWISNADGSLSYTISDIKSYFSLTDEEMRHVSGIFVILKNEEFQTSDKYVRLLQKNDSRKDPFNGVVRFNVTVPKGTKQVYVSGTFGKEGDELFWSHTSPKLRLKKIDDSHFSGTISGVPADLEYLYVWGDRIDQAESRLTHRPLGGRTKVNDIVDCWGNMTLNVTVPKNTLQVYVSGNFNNWGYTPLTDAGNNTWVVQISPTELKNGDLLEYRYYFGKDKDSAEPERVRKTNFEGFATQFDEIKSW